MYSQLVPSPGASPPILVLPSADLHSDVATQQQLPLPELPPEPATRVLGARPLHHTEY